MANIIFLDQPAGTGFSYAKNPEAYKCSDTLSASRTYDFLKKVRMCVWRGMFMSKNGWNFYKCCCFLLQWFINHPKYLNNPLYIAGGSYSGITVPLVVQQVYNGIIYAVLKLDCEMQFFKYD